MVWLTPARIVREVGLAEFVDEGPDPYTGPMSEVVVGVVDTGVVVRDGELHPFLRDRIRFDPGRDVDPEPFAEPGSFAESADHGTFVAGVLLRAAPTVTVAMKGVIDRSRGQAEDAAVVGAIEELTGDGIKLINLSFSGNSWEGRTPEGLERALNALDAGTVVVAAGGNDPTSTPVYPAATRLRKDGALLIAVGAADTTGAEPRLADFSCYGNWVRAYAPGRSILGPHDTARWARWSGTSFATAAVTGTIASAMAQTGLDARTAAEHLLDAPTTIRTPDGRQGRFIRPPAAFDESVAGL